MLEQKDWTGPGQFNQEYFTFTPSIPSVTIEINDPDAQGQYTLILKAISEDGTELIQDEFTVSANPGACDPETATMTPPIVLSQDLLSFELYEQNTINFELSQIFYSPCYSYKNKIEIG